MSVFTYLRLDNGSSVQKRELLKVVADYAAKVGVACPPSEFTIEDCCDPTYALDKRPGFSSLMQMLKEGDVLLTPHFGAIGGHATSAERFLRTMNGRGVAVHVAEMQCDLTTKLGSIMPMLKTFAQWESRLIAAEQQLADRDEIHEKALEEYTKMALQTAAERFAKADIAGALRDAMKAATAQAAIYANERRGPTYRETITSKRALEHLERVNPGILDQPFPG